MKMYLLNNIELIPKMKRLIKLKADLGLCIWSNDYSDCKFDIQSLVDVTEDMLDSIKSSAKILKELSDEEDMTFFEYINSDATISRLLDTGIVDNDAKNMILQDCPSFLIDVIEEVSESSFIWIV